MKTNKVNFKEFDRIEITSKTKDGKDLVHCELSKERLDEMVVLHGEESLKTVFMSIVWEVYKSTIKNEEC